MYVCACTFVCMHGSVGVFECEYKNVDCRIEMSQLIIALILQWCRRNKWNEMVRYKVVRNQIIWKDLYSTILVSSKKSSKTGVWLWPQQQMKIKQIECSWFFGEDFVLIKCVPNFAFFFFFDFRTNLSWTSQKHSNTTYAASTTSEW